MAKIQRLDPSEFPEIQAATEEPIPQAETKTIEFELARGRGMAVFRAPIAADLARTELSIGRLGGEMSEAQKINFCRSLAKLCCIQWGDAPEMPAPEKIRAQDDERGILLFGQQLLGDGADPSEFCQLLEGESSRNDGFDAFAVTLSDGTVLVFNEPTQLDSQRREKARTSTDGTIQFATALLQTWGGKEQKWSEAQIRFSQMELVDFFRVGIGLQFFRE